MQLRDHEGVKGKRDAYPFDPRLLKIDPDYNVRDLSSPEARPGLDELKEMIRTSGVKTPLEVRLSDDEVFIVAGHRRHKVVMELIEEGVEIETVLVLHEAKGTNDAERTLNLVLSNSGAPLKPLEVAKVVGRLDAYGWEHANIAKRLGWKSVRTVTDHLEMLGMPAAVQQQVSDGVVSGTTALHVVRETRDAKTDPAFAAELIRNAAEEKRRLGKKGRATPKAVNKALDKVRPPKAKPPVAPPQPGIGDGGATPIESVAVYTQPPEPELNTQSRSSDVVVFGIDPGQEEPDGQPVEHVNGDAGSVYKSSGQNIIADLVDALEPFAKIGLTRDTDADAPDMIDGPDLSITPTQIRAARAAIAQAEGRSP